MSKRKQTMSEGKTKIIEALLEEYDIETTEDIQNALKDLLGGTIQTMMEAEMDYHLGYEPYARSENPNARNGRKRKMVRSKFGEFTVNVPQDRESSFEPEIVKKRQKVIYTTNAIESLNSTYRRLNGQRSVFPSEKALLKALYLATLQATKKWTLPLRNWGKVYGEFSIMYDGRITL